MTAYGSLGAVTPADVSFGRANAMLEERKRIKEETIRQRRLLNQSDAALQQPTRAKPA